MLPLKLVCFLQGENEPFEVEVVETGTIDYLKRVILIMKGKDANEAEKYSIWKISIPVDEADILRKDPPELGSGRRLNNRQPLSVLGRRPNDHIQVFMGCRGIHARGVSQTPQFGLQGTTVNRYDIKFTTKAVFLEVRKKWQKETAALELSNFDEEGFLLSLIKDLWGYLEGELSLQKVVQIAEIEMKRYKRNLLKLIEDEEDERRILSIL
ncbi:hypothetical protein GLOIN_2v1485372 [Rhizophagus irregularis DAOM 181602=DAOM 197198]|uniref:Crinkler effector protein N-terminal domain-containing protein n=2 Tax=Rhizophagus irregularis TaxID=588596 RepID=A0A2P4PAT1_RHIID|nr:hypothetical protein GLOIN_2v1485372 [Rhizophagus irregularis DAOM 181602=DAOM 197198]POG62493.1 hypothetical protein GLOIN_2v1485372 [Rhizophagus irregularis DAOM 181602=DAOM 197198]|eukprot:XP_025169359.1 hypothetical protein GLOIN_2v1485372 [Rhizophagus irregularis DAOM 181602=DAOM 197198]